VEKWAEEKPDAEALVFNQERLSWRDFKEKMDKVAKAYLEVGVQKGDVVALISMGRIEFLTTFYAAGKVGAVWLGLSPKFTLDELRYEIGDSKPKVLITLREYYGKDLSEYIKTLMKEFPFLKKVLVIGEPFEGAESFAEFVERPREQLNEVLEKRASEVRDDDKALLIYTSGSTGKPKGVIHTHKSIIANNKVEAEKFHFTETSRALMHFPITHVAADTELGVAPVIAGGSIVLMDKFDPAETLKVIEKERITHLGQIPTMYLLEFKQPEFFNTDFSSIKIFISSGAIAPKVVPEVLSSICKKTGAKLIMGYGTTETEGFVTYSEVGDDWETLMKNGFAGKAAFELKIVDENRRELPDGKIGEIAVRGPILMKGYLNKPELTAEVIDKEGWFYTSDLAYKDERGYIYIVGRKSEMFKSGGENVYPREIEDVLESHDSIMIAAVIGVPDEIYGEVGWAFVMPKPGKIVTEDELRELCKSKLANFKVPKRFIISPTIPLGPTGKADKIAIKKLILEMRAKEGNSSR
jgi:acyl-CoA synthetase (AMP-forming)/AMP-acid ligase II